MNIFIDTANNTLINDPLFKSGVDNLSFKRGDDTKLFLNFVSGNTALSATAGPRIIFGAKQSGDYDASSFVVATSGYSIVNNSYLLTPSFNTSTLNALLSGDISSINLMGEISVSYDSGASWTSTNTFGITVNNDVIRNNNAAPEDLPNPIDWLNEQRPPALFDQLNTPVDAFIETIHFSLSGNIITLLTASGNQWTSDGSDVPPVSGTWYRIIKQDVYSHWQLDKFVNETYIGYVYSSGVQNSWNPSLADWSPNGLSATWNSDYTPGVLGQMFITEDPDLSRKLFINMLDDAPHGRWIQFADVPF
jgi:hypothetical protein